MMAMSVEKIVRTAGLTSTDIALEIGPGLGSLTLAMLEEAQSVVAVEIDSSSSNVNFRQPQAKHSERADTVNCHHSRCSYSKDSPVAPDST
jgi:16S rRNA (adenine1518-N6/adenine1519-N6)-dimethyltransferase